MTASISPRTFVYTQKPAARVIAVGTPGPRGQRGMDGTPGTGANSFVRTNEDYVEIPAGAPVFAFSGTGIRRAVASGVAYRVLGLAREIVPLPGTGQIIAEGVLSLTVAEWDSLTGMVGGLVPNKLYFLDPVRVGKITIDPPTNLGEWVCKIGVAYSPTDLYVDIGLCIQN